MSAQERGTKELLLDVVSVRPTPSGVANFTQNVTPTRLDYRGLPLDRIVVQAFGGSKYVIDGMPDWTTREHFDMAVTTVGRINPQEVPSILRQVLEGRFSLKWHTETRPVPVYALVRTNARTLGPGLVAIEKDCAPDLATRTTGCDFRIRSTGEKIGETRWSTVFGLIRAAASAERYVVDHTGLSGSFRVNATWTAQPKLNDDAGPPTIFTAVREQMGLRLEPRIEPVEIVVIDSIARPTPN